jgi:hypothetical protein
MRLPDHTDGGVINDWGKLARRTFTFDINQCPGVKGREVSNGDHKNATGRVTAKNDHVTRVDERIVVGHDKAENDWKFSRSVFRAQAVRGVSGAKGWKSHGNGWFRESAGRGCREDKNAREQESQREAWE